MATDDEVVEDEVVSEAAPVESTETVESTAAPETESPWYSDLGEGFNGLSEDAARERIRYQLQESQRVAQEAAGYKTLLLRQQQEQQARQQAAQPQPGKPKRVVPEYDPAWLQLVQKDKDGNVVSLPGAMPDLPAKIAAYAKWQQDQITKFVNDPAAYYQETMQESGMQQVQQAIQSQLVPYMQNLASVLAVNKWEDGNSDILFEPGTKNLTWAGKAIVDRARNYLANGEFNRVNALERATKDLHYDLMLNGQINGHANGKPANTEQALRVAAQQSRRRPSKQVPSETATQPRPRQSFKDIAIKEFETAGVGLNDKLD